MTIRRYDLEAALNDLIVNQRGIDFQRLGVELARRRRSDIVAAERYKDGGEDAYSLSILPDGRSLSVACSITATATKILSDIEKIKERKPHLGHLWFYTPHAPATITIDKWRALVKERFDVDLIVFSREEIVGLLLNPENHYLAYNHLKIIRVDGVHRTDRFSAPDANDASDPSDVNFCNFEVRLSDSWIQFIAFLKERDSEFEIELVCEDVSQKNSFNCSSAHGGLTYPVTIVGAKNGAKVRQHLDLIQEWLHPQLLRLAGENVGEVWDTALFTVRDDIGSESFLSGDKAKVRDCTYSVSFRDSNLVPRSNGQTIGPT